MMRWALGCVRGVGSFGRRAVKHPLFRRHDVASRWVVQITLHDFYIGWVDGQGLKAHSPFVARGKLGFHQTARGVLVLSDQDVADFVGQDVTEDYSKSQRVNAFMKTLHSIPKDHDADAATREWMGYGHCKPWLILQGFIHKSDIDSLQAAVAACTHCHRRLGIGEGAPDQADPRLGQHLGGDVLGW